MPTLALLFNKFRELLGHWGEEGALVRPYKPPAATYDPAKPTYQQNQIYQIFHQNRIAQNTTQRGKLTGRITKHRRKIREYLEQVEKDDQDPEGDFSLLDVTKLVDDISLAYADAFFFKKVNEEALKGNAAEIARAEQPPEGYWEGYQETYDHGVEELELLIGVFQKAAEESRFRGALNALRAKDGDTATQLAERIVAVTGDFTRLTRPATPQADAAEIEKRREEEDRQRRINQTAAIVAEATRRREEQERLKRLQTQQAALNEASLNNPLNHEEPNNPLLNIGVGDLLTGTSANPSRSLSQPENRSWENQGLGQLGSVGFGGASGRTADSQEPAGNPGNPRRRAMFWDATGGPPMTANVGLASLTSHNQTGIRQLPTLDFPQEGAAAPENNVVGNALSMFSQSLATQFDIRRLVPEPFDGSPGKYAMWELQWIRADQQMKALGFSPAYRFWELQKALKGTPLGYIKNLPPGEDSSYDRALEILTGLYRETKSLLRDLTRNLQLLPQSDQTLQSRTKLHSAIVIYRQGMQALGITPAEALLAFELNIIESKLDPAWKTEWLKFAVKYRSSQNNLGTTVTLNDLLTKLHESLLQMMQANESKRLAERQQQQGNKRPEQRPGSKDKKGATGHAFQAHNTATTLATSNQNQRKPSAVVPPNLKRSPQKQGNSGGNSAIREPCPFCAQQGRGQRYEHAFPRTCPLIKGTDGARVMTSDELREQCRKKSLCKNCFLNHRTENCDSPACCKCAECGKRHHTLLHSGPSNNKKPFQRK